MVVVVVFGSITAVSEKDGREELNTNISDLLDDLDLSELQKYLEDSSSVQPT